MWLKKEGGEDEQKSSEIKKRLIGAIPDFIGFLLLILCFRFWEEEMAPHGVGKKY